MSIDELKQKAREAKSDLCRKFNQSKDDLKAAGIVGGVGLGILGLGALIGAVKGYGLGFDAGGRQVEAAVALFEPEAHGRIVSRLEAFNNLK